MANTTSINSELFQNLLVQSQYALYENSIARAVATIYDYPVGAGKTVSVPIWAGITASKPGEGAAPQSPSNAETNSKTIALEEHVAFAEVTDFLRDSAQENVIASLADQMGLALAESLDKELIALFTAASGGNPIITQAVGTAATGSPLVKVDNTVQDLMKAAAIIRSQKYQGPLFAVLNPIQAYGLKAALTATNNFQNATDVGNAVLNQYFVGSIAGITILEHALVAVDGSSKDAVGCVFAPAAFGLAQRGGVQMETERNAAKRSTDVVETVVAGAGILRPELAVRVIGNAEV
jgi:N4-gp56 family major capsid protein